VSYPVTRITVKDTPPPMSVVAVGRYYDLTPQPEVEEEDSTEVKVVRRGRRPAPKSTEGAETK